MNDKTIINLNSVFVSSEEIIEISEDNTLLDLHQMILSLIQ